MTEEMLKDTKGTHRTVLTKGKTKPLWYPVRPPHELLCLQALGSPYQEPLHTLSTCFPKCFLPSA